MEENTRKIFVPDFRFVILTGEDNVPNDTATVGKICFSRVSGIESTMEQEEIAEGGKNDGPHILLAPHKRHSPLVLERGVVPAESWMCRLRPGMRLGTWLMVILLDEKGTQTKRKFTISDGIVTKWELSGLDAMGNSVLVEKLEIVHDGITYQ